MSRDVIIITGAGRGLGRAYALACAQRDAAVVVNDVDAIGAEDTLSQIRAAGGEAISSVGSVADWSYVSLLVERCVARFGTLTGLVNNAGVLHSRHIWEEEPIGVHEIISSNLVGTMYCGAIASRYMLTHGGGSIVNVTSSSQRGVEKLSTYGATKSAITTLTVAWAAEGRAGNIRVNAVAPMAATSILQNWQPSPEEMAAVPSYGTADQVAPLVAYLASSRSAPHTGKLIRNDGTSLSPLLPPGYASDRRLCAQSSEEAIGTFLAETVYPLMTN